jgi:hypothetical protein
MSDVKVKDNKKYAGSFRKHIIVAAIKEILRTVKKQMFDDLFHQRILEKIKP